MFGPYSMKFDLGIMDKEQNEDDINEDVSDGRRLLPHASKMIMNERVQNLAAAVYQEFEKMISNYDANVVKNLMPIVVEMLETLESAYIKTDELEIQLEMLSEEFEQLESEYQKEKKLRMGAAERHLELVDTLEAHQEESNSKLNTLNSVIKTYETKVNGLETQANLSDQEKQEKKEKSVSTIINDTQEEIDQLLLTKNALTAVKDDLVRTVDKKMIENDELDNEYRSLQEKKEILQRQINSLQKENSQAMNLDSQIIEESHADKVEDDLPNTSESNLESFEVELIRDRVKILESAVNAIAEESPIHASHKLDEDDDFWDAEGNHFTWAEMEKVLLERNQYKVQYMELQEAIRWTANMNAMKAETKSGRMTLFGSRPNRGKGSSSKKETDQRHLRQNSNGIRRFFAKFM